MSATLPSDYYAEGRIWIGPFPENPGNEIIVHCASAIDGTPLDYHKAVILNRTSTPSILDTEANSKRLQ
jgi:hypothetical protein